MSGLQVRWSDPASKYIDHGAVATVFNWLAWNFSEFNSVVSAYGQDNQEFISMIPLGLSEWKAFQHLPVTL